MPAQKKPAQKPRSAPAKKQVPAAKKRSSAAKKQAPPKQSSPLRLGFFLGALGLLILCVAFIPGQLVWSAVQGFFWGGFGFTFLLWAGFCFFCAYLLFRYQDLRAQRAQLLGLASMIVLLGVLDYLLLHPAETFLVNAAQGAASAPSWTLLVSQAIDHTEETWKASEVLRNGGLLSVAIGVSLGLTCGKLGASAVSLLLLLPAILFSFPSLRTGLAARLTSRSEKKEQAAPEEPLPRKPSKKETQAQLARTQTLPLEEISTHLPEEADDDGLRKKLFENLGLLPLGGKEKKQEDQAADQNVSAQALEQRSVEELAQVAFPSSKQRAKAQQAGEAVKKAAQSAPSAEGASDTKEGYAMPPLSCLSLPRAAAAQPDSGEEDMIARKLLRTLESFGVAVDLVGRSRGPAVTRYELRPAEGVKISKITALADDIALRLAATKVRIEAPIPGKPAVGVEVPNRVRAVVSLRELVDSENYRAGAAKSNLTVALGKDIVGSLVCADLAKL
ncbi:MAG: hypothetical protein LBQ33_07155, partial [Oscillospiraceae bacterium]|nr:hypothetical protein [Oscillospiraceae bacterium]